jgi:hypothetical protein
MGASTGTILTNGTFTVTRLNGTKGDTGSGSSITLQDEGSPVSGTPHSTLNLTGAGVTVTNIGGGVGQIDVPAATLFGTEAQDAATSTLVTQTGPTWNTYLTLTTPVVPAGRYRVGMAFTWAHGSTNNNINVELFQDGTTTLWNIVQEPQDAAITQRISASGFAYVTFATAASHTFDIRFQAQSAGNTARAQQGAIEFWRIS